MEINNAAHKKYKPLLRKVKKLLSDKKRWCAFTAARTEDGYSTSVLSKEAAKWCLLGACCKVEGTNEEGELIEYARHLLRMSTFGSRSSLSMLNDQQGYDAVMKFLERNT